MVWRDPGCESNPTASDALSHCDRVIGSGKGPFLAQKRCLTLELLNQVSRKQEKVQEGDSMSVHSSQHSPVAPPRDAHFLSDLSMLMLTGAPSSWSVHSAQAHFLGCPLGHSCSSEVPTRPRARASSGVRPLFRVLRTAVHKRMKGVRREGGISSQA